MSTQNAFVEYGNLPAAIPRVLRQLLLSIYTAMPGEIVSYDATNRRADVRGQMSLVLSDETQVERPIILNVPVVFPMSDTFGMTWPLHAGDSVLLVFSQRGLGNWKSTHASGPPTVDSLLSEEDAIVWPGFGPVGAHAPAVSITAERDSLSITVKDPADVDNVDAHRRIDLNAAEVKLTFGDDAAFVRLSDGAIQIDKGSDHVALGLGFIRVNLDGVGQFLMDSTFGVQVAATNGPINIISTTGVTVNGKAVADADQNTGTAAGHSHSLTAA